MIRGSSVLQKRLFGRRQCRAMSKPSFATVDPDTMSGSNVHEVKNLLGGAWASDSSTEHVVDPLNGEIFMKVPLSKGSVLDSYVTSLNSCPKSGLHNPFKNPERYWLYGDVSAAAAARLKEPEV